MKARCKQLAAITAHLPNGPYTWFLALLLPLEWLFPALDTVLSESEKNGHFSQWFHQYPKSVLNISIWNVLKYRYQYRLRKIYWSQYQYPTWILHYFSVSISVFYAELNSFKEIRQIWLINCLAIELPQLSYKRNNVRSLVNFEIWKVHNRHLT